MDGLKDLLIGSLNHILKKPFQISCDFFHAEKIMVCFVCSVCVCFLLSAADMGKLLQCPDGHQDPGYLYYWKVDGTHSYHCCWPH